MHRRRISFLPVMSMVIAMLMGGLLVSTAGPCQASTMPMAVAASDTNDPCGSDPSPAAAVVCQLMCQVVLPQAPTISGVLRSEKLPPFVLPVLRMNGTALAPLSPPPR